MILFTLKEFEPNWKWNADMKMYASSSPTPELIEEELDYEYDKDFDDAASIISVASSSAHTHGKTKYSDTKPANLKLSDKKRVKWTKKLEYYLFVIRSQDEVFRIHHRRLVAKMDDPGKMKLEEIPVCIEDSILKYNTHLHRKNFTFDRRKMKITESCGS